MEKNVNLDIYKTYIFRDRITSAPILKLSVLNHLNHEDTLKEKVKELTEKYCLPATDIIIE